MAIRTILQQDIPMLFMSNLAVNLGEDISSIVTDLVDTMHESGLIAIAAPQIGIHKQIFITEIRKTPRRSPDEIDQLRVYINHRITSFSSEQIGAYEGCGSVNSIGRFGKVYRASEIVVEAWDQNFKRFTLRCNGLLARAIQHEIDHVQGKVFTAIMHNEDRLVSEAEYLTQIKPYEAKLSQVTIKELKYL